MVNIMNFASQYAEEIGGQYTDYDHTKSVIVVPLEDGRFQTVLATSKRSASGAEQVAFTSKICEFDSGVNLKELLEKNSQFDYGKFILEEGYLKMMACVNANATEDQVKEMINEVATQADQYELRLTGQDVH